MASPIKGSSHESFLAYTHVPSPPSIGVIQETTRAQSCLGSITMICRPSLGAVSIGLQFITAVPFLLVHEVPCRAAPRADT